MFTRIQARHFRCLKLVDQRLDRFQALAGPNASGMTTFLNLITLLSDLVRNRGDVPAAIRMRSADFAKLLWNGEGSPFRTAAGSMIAPDAGQRIAREKQKLKAVRDEVAIASQNGYALHRSPSSTITSFWGLTL